MPFRMIGAVTLALAAAACGGPQDTSKPPAGSRRSQSGEARAEPDPLANALAFKCEDGQQLRIDLESRPEAAIVRLGDNPAATLLLDKASDVRAYTDGTITLGMSGGSEVAFTHAPDAPLVCRHVSISLPEPQAADVEPHLHG